MNRTHNARWTIAREAARLALVEAAATARHATANVVTLCPFWKKKSKAEIFLLPTKQ